MDEPTELPQRVPEDGVYVTYWWDTGKHFNAAHQSLTAAVVEAGDICKIGFARWDSDEIEDIRKQPEDDDR